MTENGKNAFGAISVDFGIFGNLRTRVRLGLTLRLGQVCPDSKPDNFLPKY